MATLEQIVNDEDAIKAAEGLMKSVTRFAGIKLLQIIAEAAKPPELTAEDMALIERAEWLTRNLEDNTDDEVHGLVRLVKRLAKIPETA